MNKLIKNSLSNLLYFFPFYNKQNKNKKEKSIRFTLTMLSQKTTPCKDDCSESAFFGQHIAVLYHDDPQQKGQLDADE